MKKHLLFILFILTGLNIFAQTYNMPTNGYLEIHSDSGTIYDDGGPTGNYSTRVNSTVTIYPSTPGGLVCLQGTYDLEDLMYSVIRVYDGDTNSTWELWHGYWNNSVNILSYSGPLTIRFFADTENPKLGFQFNFTVNVLNATNQTNNITNNNTTATINWSGTTSDHWIVHLRFGDQNWIQTTNSNSAVFDSLPFSCYHYEYSVYEPKDTNSLNCLRFNHFYIPPSFSLTNVQYERKCDTLIIRWDESDTSIHWKINYYNLYTNEPPPAYYWDSRYIIAYSDTNYIELDVSNDALCEYNFNNSIEGYAYLDRILIEGKKGDGHYCLLTDQNIEPVCCCPKPVNLYISDLQSNNATISWNVDTNSTGWIVEYNDYKYPDDSIKYVTVNTNSVTLSNLTPTTRYSVRVHSLCDSLIFKCSSKIDLITSIRGLDNCFSFTNLRDTNFAPYTGSYSNPNQNFGLIDYGYWDVRSRHTVHYDTSEVDPRTDSLLHTVPPGEEASVRLGNWLPGGEGESFTYAYDVDTNIFDLMYLRYAVVMENPGHTMTNQPRFTLEILNANDTLIDPVCGYADFFASDSLGWNSVPGTVTIWKDWTLVGFDITPYHGQRILVRLTTRDCDEGGHFGYAYYHLKCGSKKLKSTKCGIVDSNTFIAPIGFNYKWYSSADTSTVLSTDRILDAVVDSTVNYHCLVSSTENPSCTFHYTAYGGYRFPLSQLTYDYTWSPCEYTVNFKNLSTISANGITPAGTNETCETSLWIFPDGDTINTTNATKTFSDTSEVRVRLISGIANNECINILDTVLKLSRPYDPLEISGDTSICFQANTILRLNYSSEKFYWSTADTTSSINVTPLVDTKYYVEVVDSLGCYNFDSINIYVHPMDTTIIYAEICQNEIYSENGFNTNTEGIHEQKLISQWGCDSIVYLNLTVHPTFIFDTIKAIICENNPYTDHGLNLDSTGIYTANLQTIYGCDSIFIVKIHANPVYHDTIKADIYKGNVYNLYGFSEKETGVYSRELKTYLGCDSIIYLDLQVDNVLFPNVVTPNGDGINDVFTLNNLVEQDAFPENELIIFNRQGKMIYQKKNIKVESDFWDPQQTKTPNGTYFFRFIGSRHDKKIDKVGSIEVLR